MRVLSLFDGIACGRLALERAGIDVEVYYASEIDSDPMKIAKYNYPDIIELGDINNIDFSEYIGKVDLIIGGSPCQNLSTLGNRKGLQGEQSGLFYKFVEALNVIKPKYFLLENNYGMAQDAYDEMSRLVGCYPVLLDSSRVSAQNRKRFYWTNFGPKIRGLVGMSKGVIPQPEDKGILLSDVLENKLMTAINRTDWLDKKLKIMADKYGYVPLMFNAYSCYEIIDKAPTQTTCCGSRSTSAAILRFMQAEGDNLYTVKDGKIQIGNEYFTINLSNGTYGITPQTPTECERLQTLPDDYTKYGRVGDDIVEISNASRYKAIGNGWTVDIIAHIFKYLQQDLTKVRTELTI